MEKTRPIAYYALCASWGCAIGLRVFISRKFIGSTSVDP